MSVEKLSDAACGDEVVMMPPALAGRRNARRQALSILAWLLAVPVLAGASEGSDVPPARDFAADAQLARERAVPILVFFSRPGCSWCELTRRELRALGNDPASPRRVLVREIVLDSDAPVRDFDGRATTQRTFAEAREIRFTPTLEFLDDHGRRAAEPIVGTRTPDFYGATIERAIDEAAGRLVAVSKSSLRPPP